MPKVIPIKIKQKLAVGTPLVSYAHMERGNARILKANRNGGYIILTDCGNTLSMHKEALIAAYYIPHWAIHHPKLIPTNAEFIAQQVEVFTRLAKEYPE